jgi:hypothetical protein
LTFGLAATAVLFSGARHLEQARAESDFRKRGESYITTVKKFCEYKVDIAYVQ